MIAAVSGQTVIGLMSQPEQPKSSLPQPTHQDTNRPAANQPPPSSDPITDTQERIQFLIKQIRSQQSKLPPTPIIKPQPELCRQLDDTFLFDDSMASLLLSQHDEGQQFYMENVFDEVFTPNYSFYLRTLGNLEQDSMCASSSNRTSILSEFFEEEFLKTRGEESRNLTSDQWQHAYALRSHQTLHHLFVEKEIVEETTPPFHSESILPEDDSIKKS